jgi:hypothetical protein
MVERALKRCDGQTRWLLADGRLPAPAPTPASAPTASAADESEDQEEQQRADGGVDDRRDNTNAKVDAELGQQPLADEGADDSDDEVTDDPKAGALHDLARQPSGHDTDYQYDKETFARHVHFRKLQVQRPIGRSRAARSGCPIDKDALAQRRRKCGRFRKVRGASVLCEKT